MSKKRKKNGRRRLEKQLAVAAQQTRAMAMGYQEQFGIELGLTAEMEPGCLARIDQMYARFEEALLNLESQVCPHLGATPQPVIVFLGDLTTLHCLWCSEEESRSLRGTKEDFTCDSCRTFDPTGVHPIYMTRGVFTFSGGFCDNCYGRGKSYTHRRYEGDKR